MLPYNQKPKQTFEIGDASIQSFIDIDDTNIDWETVDSFGEEWGKFSEFSETEIQQIGNDYFDIVPDHVFKNATVLDVGCGSGRWSKFLTDKVDWIEAIDPSKAVFSAFNMLKENRNVRVTQASVESIPFNKESFDLVISLGVLHHIPDTQKALSLIVEHVKKGGACLIYLYYNLDNRGFFYKLLFKMSDLLRKGINKLPAKIKKLVCDIIALLVYWPLSRIALIFKYLAPRDFYKRLPLSYYHDKSMNILRNDSLDRFGTPLEQRFSRQKIKQMMEFSGLSGIVFSQKAPFWHAIGFKK